ncbi:MAG: glycosyltransferase family 2 protein [Candidatus Heimdallarchaeota archaeon]|nr:MAG: glycosyltransferase family 2 protein [Candidatus Heimdallarchaeota archaeon]
MKTADFLILLPAYNEENSLSSVINQLGNLFSLDQLILADDGSTDNTSIIAKEIGIRIIRNRRNRGKGSILRSSFITIIKKFPTFKWVVTIDSDGQHDCQDIVRFLKTISLNPEVDIIVGKRDYSQMPPVNWISNKLTSRWSNYWLNWNLTDLQCGFRCYNTTALRKILNFGLKKNKFDLETEILLVAWLLDLKIVEIPIKTLYPRNRRKSRIRPVFDTMRWILLVFQYAFTLKFVNKVWQNRFLLNLRKKRVKN